MYLLEIQKHHNGHKQRGQTHHISDAVDVRRQLDARLELMNGHIEEVSEVMTLIVIGVIIPCSVAVTISGGILCVRPAQGISDEREKYETIRG